jgi:tRNA nucleotidyltransferase (CCA-adding enzyme)
MDKCPAPGKNFSLRLIDADRARVHLRALVHTTPLAPILAALGADAATHIVGGTVRDALLDAPPSDIDIASKLPPEVARERLVAAGLHTVDTGLKHGTIMIVLDGHHVELTTFRTKHPTVYAETIAADLSLRDFTINAIAYSVCSDSIVDPYGGVNDLAAHHLRAVGAAAERFSEDPLRMLRMIRFGPAEGRTIEADCVAFTSAHTALLRDVSVERVRTELERILVAPEAGAALRSLVSTGLAQEVLPELLPTVGFEQNAFHIHDVFEHTIWVLERAPRELSLRLAALFHDLGKPPSLSIGANGERHFYRHEELSATLCLTAMRRLKFSNDLTDSVASVVRHHMRPLDCGPAGVRRILRDLGDQYSAWRQMKIADAPPLMSADEFTARLAAFDALVESEFARRKGSVYGKLAVDGEDLKAIGCTPGPGMGRLLRFLHEIVIEDPDLNEKAELLRRAEAYLINPTSE